MNTVTNEGSLYYTAIKHEPEKTLCAHDTIQHHWAEKGVLQFTCLTRKRNNVLLLCNTHQSNKPQDWSNFTTVTITDSGIFFLFLFCSAWMHVPIYKEDHECIPAVKLLQLGE